MDPVAEGNIERDSHEETVLKHIQSHEDGGDARRAFQKVVAEKQELRDQNTALKQENEALVAEHEEQRIGWMEQGPWKAREEVLLSENQHLKERNKELSAGRPISASTNTLGATSNECFYRLLGFYFDQKRDAPPSNEPNNEPTIDALTQAGEAARRRRSLSRSRRSSHSTGNPNITSCYESEDQVIDTQYTDGLIQAGEVAKRRSQSRSRRSSRSSWEPQPPLVEPNIQSCHASDGQQVLVDAQLARDVRSLPPVWLHTLLRDKQWRKFSEVVRLLDKVDGQNKRLLSKMTEDALHAYVRSQEFRNNPQKLCSLLQEVGCQIHTPPTSDSIKTRHSVPQTLMSNNRLQSMDGETKRPSSYPTLTHHATKIAVSVA